MSAARQHFTAGGARKVRFPSRELAKAQMRARFGKSARRGMTAYRCDTCAGWHIGNDLSKNSPETVAWRARTFR